MIPNVPVELTSIRFTSSEVLELLLDLPAAPPAVPLTPAFCAFARDRRPFVVAGIVVAVAVYQTIRYPKREDDVYVVVVVAAIRSNKNAMVTSTHNALL